MFLPETKPVIDDDDDDDDDDIILYCLFCFNLYIQEIGFLRKQGNSACEVLLNYSTSTINKIL